MTARPNPTMPEVTFAKRFIRGGHLFCEGVSDVRWIESEDGDLVVAPGTKVRPWITSLGARLWELPITRDGESNRTAITETERLALVERGWISEEIGEEEPSRMYLCETDVAREIAVNLTEGLDAIGRQTILDTIERGVLRMPEADQDGEADMRLRAVLEALREIGATL